MEHLGPASLAHFLPKDLSALTPEQVQPAPSRRVVLSLQPFAFWEARDRFPGVRGLSKADVLPAGPLKSGDSPGHLFCRQVCGKYSTLLEGFSNGHILLRVP